MKQGDVVKFTNPTADETDDRFILLENPDGGRVLAQAIVDLPIRPTYIFRTEELAIIDIPASKAAAALGKLGGRSTSDAKRKASAENGKLGGRPRKAK